MPPRIDMTGKTFGAYVVLRGGGLDSFGQALWICRCQCGTEKAVQGGKLRAGESRSCGCLRGKHSARLKHGAAAGGKLTAEYMAWSHMIERCERPANKSFADYGAREIRVSELWRHDFARFLADMGERPSRLHSIDRVDNEKGYEPGNCRWALRDIQNRNKRSNVNITLNGETKTMAEWCRARGMDTSVVCIRLKKGWDPERALTRLRPPRRGAALLSPMPSAEVSA